MILLVPCIGGLIGIAPICRLSRTDCLFVLVLRDVDASHVKMALGLHHPPSPRRRDQINKRLSVGLLVVLWNLVKKRSASGVLCEQGPDAVCR